MSSVNIISQLYNSRKVLLEQMEYKDFNTDEYSSFSINELNSLYKNKQLDMILEKNDINRITNKKEKVYIKYYISKILKPNNVEEIIDELFNLEEILTKNDTLVIVTKDDLNDTMKNLLISIWENDGIFIVVQNIKKLQFNLLKHVLVPQHRIMNDQELEIVKKKFNIVNINEFPKISRFDPVAIVIGIRPGEICEIKRPSKTSITSLYYRLCINTY